MATNVLTYEFRHYVGVYVLLTGDEIYIFFLARAGFM